MSENKDKEMFNKMLELLPQKGGSIIQEKCADDVKAMQKYIAALQNDFEYTPRFETENPGNINRKKFEEDFTRRLFLLRLFGQSDATYPFSSLYISKSAWEHFLNVKSKAEALRQNGKKFTTVEHTVPMGRYFVQYFIEMAKQAKGHEISEDDVKERMKLFTTTTLTAAENDKLNKRFKDKMPDDDRENVLEYEIKDRFCRMRELNIPLHSEELGWQRELIEKQGEDGWFAKACLERYKKILKSSK